MSLLFEAIVEIRCTHHFSQRTNLTTIDCHLGHVDRTQPDIPLTFFICIIHLGQKQDGRKHHVAPASGFLSWPLAFAQEISFAFTVGGITRPSHLAITRAWPWSVTNTHWTRHLASQRSRTRGRLCGSGHRCGRFRKARNVAKRASQK